MNATARMTQPRPAEPEQAAPPAPPAKRSALASALWVVGAGLVVGLGSFAGSFAASRWLGPPAKTATAETEKEPEEKTPSAGVPGPVGLRGIDEMIEEGRFAQALDACRASAGANEPLSPPMTYRAALCFEGLGRPAEAAAAYRQCLATGASDHLVAAARLGLARCVLRQGQLDEGRELLCGILLRSAQPALRARPYAAEALVMLSLMLADEFQPAETPAPTRPTALAHAPAGTGVENYVGWDVPPRGPGSRPAAGWTPTGSLSVSRAGAPPGEPRVDASMAAGPVADRLQRLAEADGSKVEWGPGAKDALLGREGELACAAAPLGDVLAWLTLPFGLTAQTDGKLIKVRLTAKLAAAEKRRLRGELAMSTLRAALTAAANHPQSGHLYLALGNLEAALGRLAEARGWYERLLRERPRSPAVMQGMYNLGLLRLQDGDLLLAREAFYQALDRAPGHEMTALCFWWIARTHLDEADTEAARRALLRCAQAGSGGKEVAAAAGLGLACAHLYDGQPRPAWEALNAARQAVQEPPYLDPAALLDGLARYQLAGDNLKRREAALPGLVGAALSPRESPWLGPMLPYLRGKALGLLGLGQEMVALYERQARATHGKLAERMELEVGEAFQAAGQDAPARARFEKLFRAGEKTGNRELMATATLRLAGLDLRARQPDACLRRCRALLEDKTAPRAEVLGLMSRAYTSKGDYARAAACLAGEVPAP
jgi:tetratricopeptide (TPR) repeat protein